MSNTGQYNLSHDDIEKLKSSYKPSLYLRYYNHVRGMMKEKYKICNLHAVPSISKIYVTSAISYKQHSLELLQKVYNCLYLITGQLPVYTRSNYSISQFKIYKKSFVGAKVCLTNKTYLYEFLERLAHIYLPSIKNFNGISTKSISNNACNIGIIDAHIMPEINKFMGMETFGLTITIVVNVHTCLKDKSKEVIIELLNLLDIPIYD